MEDNTSSIKFVSDDEVMMIDDFFDQEAIEWCVWYFHQFDNQRFNNIKFIQETHWNLPFNKWFGNYVQSRIAEFMPEAKVHSIYIGNDVKPGGIHTDGWLYPGEIDLAYKTILIPLKFNVPASTIIFNERNQKAMTLNQVTGLGYQGIDNMCQAEVVNASQLFSKDIHQKYLKHLDINGLSGLTVLSVLDWVPGCAMSWFRDRWHGPVFFEGAQIDRYHVTIMTHINEKQNHH